MLHRTACIIAYYWKLIKVLAVLTFYRRQSRDEKSGDLHLQIHPCNFSQLGLILGFACEEEQAIISTPVLSALRSYKCSLLGAHCQNLLLKWKKATLMPAWLQFSVAGSVLQNAAAAARKQRKQNSQWTTTTGDLLRFQSWLFCIYLMLPIIRIHIFLSIHIQKLIF